MESRILHEDVLKFSEQFELWEALNGKTFLVTGATGLIGSVLVKCLLALKRVRGLSISIIAPVRNIEKTKSIFGWESSDIVFMRQDLTELKADSLGSHIDYIVHLASPTNGTFIIEHPFETFSLAYSSTLNLLEIAKDQECKGLVLASSIEYYGQMLDGDVVTEYSQGFIDAYSARSAYPLGKRSAEFLCYAFAKEYGVHAKTARLTQTFGAGVSAEDNRVFAQFAKSVIANEDIVLHTRGDSAKPYCYTTDAVSAMLYLLLRGNDGEAYNVANKSTYISIRDLAHFVRDRFNPSISVATILNEDQGYAPQTKLRLDTSKIEHLGWQPRYGLEEMFSRLIAHMREIKEDKKKT